MDIEDYPDGSFACNLPYVSFDGKAPYNGVTLDGTFDVEELKRIISKIEKSKFVYEVEVTEHSEFGRCFKAICPDCGSEISHLQYMRTKNNICECPKKWSFVLQAVGIPITP